LETPKKLENMRKELEIISEEKKMEYKRSEHRSFYSLSKKSIDLLGTLGLNAVKEEFRALFKQMT